MIAENTPLAFCAVDLHAKEKIRLTTMVACAG